MATATLQQTQPSTSTRLPMLDGIRGLAAAAVVLHHICAYFPSRLHPAGFLRVWMHITVSGWIGVDVFFALSGFLITSGLMTSRGRESYYRPFYIKRLARLAPPYLIVLVLVELTYPHSWRFLGLSTIYLANLAPLFGVPMIFGPLWSLAVEEHFYLLWPTVVRRASRRALLAVGLSLCALTPLARLFAIRHGEFNIFYTWFRLDGLMWGALLAVAIYGWKPERAIVARWSRTALAVGLSVFAGLLHFGLMDRRSTLDNTVCFGLVSFITTGLIGLSYARQAPRVLAFLDSRPLLFLGSISYWVYLFHLIVIEVVERALPHSTAPTLYVALLIASFGISIGTGAAVRALVENPVHKLRDRLLAGTPEGHPSREPVPA